MITIKDVRKANVNINEIAYLLRLCRILGNYIVVILANKSVNPLVVNFVNLFISILSLSLLLSKVEHNIIIATLLLFIWQLLDTVDGGIARVRKIVNNYGGYIDYITGMFIISFLPISISIAAVNNSINNNISLGFIDFEISQLTIIVIGGFSSLFSLFSRFINHTIKIRFGIDNSKTVEKDFRNVFSKILVNIENIGGLQLVFLLLSVLTDSILYYLIVYTIINGLIFITVFTHSLIRYRAHNTYNNYK